MTFRVLFAIITFFNLNINQIYIKTAFLYNLINQLIYIELPKIQKQKPIKRWCTSFKRLFMTSSNPSSFNTKN